MALWGLTDTFADVPKYLQPAETFDGTTAVSAVDNTIEIPSHPYENGDQVKYTSSAPVAELLAAGSYPDFYVVERTTDTIKLSETQGGAAISFVTVNGAVDDSVQQIAGHGAIGEGDARFIDTGEAGTEGNRATGQHTAGWTLYDTYTTADSQVRHKVEVVVAAGNYTQGVAGDTTEVESDPIDPSFQYASLPAPTTVADGETATFTVTLEETAPGTLNVDTVYSYIWEYDPLGGTAWEDAGTITGFAQTQQGRGIITNSISFPAAAAQTGATFRVTALGTYPGGDGLTLAPTASVVLTVTV